MQPKPSAWTAGGARAVLLGAATILAPTIAADAAGGSQAGSVTIAAAGLTGHSDLKKGLPSACAFTPSGSSTPGSYLDRACLMANYSHWPFLPDRCETRVNLPQGATILAYEGPCLARFGFTWAADRRGVP